MSVNRRPVVAATLVTLLAAACTSSPDHRYSGGRIGTGGAYSQHIGEGPDWGFRVEGRDLVVFREDASITVAGAAFEDGIEFRVTDETTDEPALEFRTPLGALRWIGTGLTLGREVWELEPGHRRVEPAAPVDGDTEPDSAESSGSP